jgi:hypothetical protein
MIIWRVIRRPSWHIWRRCLEIFVEKTEKNHEKLQSKQAVPVRDHVSAICIPRKHKEEWTSDTPVHISEKIPRGESNSGRPVQRPPLYWQTFRLNGWVYESGRSQSRHIQRMEITVTQRKCSDGSVGTVTLQTGVRTSGKASVLLLSGTCTRSETDRHFASARSRLRHSSRASPTYSWRGA